MQLFFYCINIGFFRQFFLFFDGSRKSEIFCMIYRFLSENVYIDKLVRFCGKVSNKKLWGLFIVMEQFLLLGIGQEMVGMVFEVLQIFVVVINSLRRIIIESYIGVLVNFLFLVFMILFCYSRYSLFILCIQIMKIY